jgi:hypothetical protein
VQVTGFEKSGKVILKYVEQPLNIISQSHPPQVLFGSPGSIKDLNNQEE